MRASSLGAILSISVDLNESQVSGGRSLETFRRAAERLVELFAAARLGVTWASMNPATSDPIASAMRSGEHHEAALFVDRRWLAGEKGRGRLISELMVRAAQARKAGLAISTLALSEPLLDPPLDLLGKYGIRAIRTVGAGRASGNSAAAAGPAALRFGLWQLNSDARLRGGSAMTQWFAAVRIRRAIDRRMRRGTPFHLAIDTAALATESSMDRLGNLPGLLQHIQRRQREGVLRVQTISQLVGLLIAPAGQRAAQSILRAA